MRIALPLLPLPLVSLSLVLPLTAIFATGAVAADYPTKAIRMVVPAPPGGSLDVIARPVAQGLSEAFGQQVVIDNRSGAAGIIGSELVAQANPDGYTLLMTNLAFAITAVLQPKMPYDPVKDFTAVSQLTKLPYVIVTTSGLPVQTLQDLITLAKQKPGTITYGSLGNGSGSHLTTELFKQMAGIEMIHVPYKGFGPLAPDLLSGRIQVAFNTIPSLLPHVKSGRLRALAISSDTRSKLLPDVPTAVTSGLPQFRVSTWHGMFAPNGIPRPVLTRLNAELVKLVNSAGMQERLAGDGAEPVGSAPAQFSTFLKSEMERWSRVVKSTKATVD